MSTLESLDNEVLPSVIIPDVAIYYLHGWCKAYHAAGISSEEASAHIKNAIMAGDKLLKAATGYRKSGIDMGEVE